jgi:hypothetical protein
MAVLRSSLLLVVMLLVAPAAAAAQQAGQTAGPSTFSTISLMVFAAGVGAMTVSLARSRARSRTRTAPQSAPAPVAAAVAAAPEPTFRPGRPSEPAPELGLFTEPVTVTVEPLVVVVDPEPAAVEREPVVEPLVVVFEPEPEPAPVEPEPEPAEAEPDPVEPEPEPVATAAAAPEQPGSPTCRINVWSGYVKQRFYAEAATGEWIAQSPPFRLEKGRTLADSPQAAAALEVLTQELTAAGWDVTPVQ